jgi:GTP-binding protein
MPPAATRVPRVLEASYLASAATVGQLPPPTGIEIAFAGRSNVGKSSLLNALMGRRGLARTSRTPGCTRQISLFEVKIAGGAVLRLVDLPATASRGDPRRSAQVGRG